MRILVIDDERYFNQAIFHMPVSARYARRYDKALEMLTDESWDKVYLDHDLGDNQPTGYDLCQKIEEFAYNGYLLNVKEFVIHSMNPLGRSRMYQCLYKYYNVSFARVEDLL